MAEGKSKLGPVMLGWQGPDLREFFSDGSGELPARVDGGYPVIYYAEDGGELCAGCANGKNGSLAADPEVQGDPQWTVMGADIHYEGEPRQCDHCGADVESAYGPVEGEEEGREG
jgi:hypothetical protein